MKRMIVLMVCLITTLLSSTAYANISKNLGYNTTVINSYYGIKYNSLDNGEPNFLLGINVQSIRGFGLVSSSNACYFIVQTDNIVANTNDHLFVFSRKNAPKIKIIKNEVSKELDLKTFYSLTDSSITYTIQKKFIEEILNSDKVYIILPTNKGETKSFEIPREILNEWQTVITTDLKKLRSDL
jgi:hypothetical protein